MDEKIPHNARFEGVCVLEKDASRKKKRLQVISLVDSASATR